MSHAGSDLLTPATGTVTVMVSLPAAWDAKKVYNAGDTVGYQGRQYLATWWTRNQTPGDPTRSWQEIAVTEDGTRGSTAARVFNTGDIAVYNGVKCQAKWYTRNQPPGSDRKNPWSPVS